MKYPASIQKGCLKGCAWILTATMATSCCTSALWRDHGTSNTIEVHYDEMTESALIEDGFAYTKNDEKQLYFIEPSPTKERLELTARVAATPVTLAADCALVLACAILELDASALLENGFESKPN